MVAATFTERFDFRLLVRLDATAAERAPTEPALGLEVAWGRPRAATVLEAAGGSPYLVQLPGGRRRCSRRRSAAAPSPPRRPTARRPSTSGCVTSPSITGQLGTVCGRHSTVASGPRLVTLKWMETLSPRVVGDGWGYVDVEPLGRFRDAKLWPGGGRGWDWRETGTEHRPGILPADVLELLDHGPDVVVLSSGREGRLGVSPDTVATLEEHGVEVVRERTDAALATYDRLVTEGRRVAALFHTTC
jgi:hypothetical protein